METRGCYDQFCPRVVIFYRPQETVSDRGEPPPAGAKRPRLGARRVVIVVLRRAINFDYHRAKFPITSSCFLISGGGTHVVGKLGLVRVYLWASLGVASVLLGWPGCSLADPEILHFPPKNACFGVESMIIIGFFGIFSLRTSLDSCMGCSEPRKPRVEVDFGLREKFTCHRIDELFKQNWPPEAQK